MKVSLSKLKSVLVEVFITHGFSKERASFLAKTHAESSLYGVNSHELNRVPQFIDHVKKGVVDIHAVAGQAETLGSIERWDGKFGPVILNANKCTDRAIALAQAYGIGLVALRNTNHWMLGGRW